MPETETQIDRADALVDLLGAMGDYFDARRAMNEAAAGYDGYSFEYHFRSETEDVSRCFNRVATQWERLGLGVIERV